MVSLGNLSNDGFRASRANDISANGEVIVGSGDPGSGWNSYRGFRWTKDSGMVAVGSLDGSPRYEAWAASADGSVIVGDGGLQAFVMGPNQGIKGIGVLPGRSRSRAVGVSSDGSVAVGSSYTASWEQEQAFRWTEKEGMVGLGFLPGSNYSFPNAISPDGSVIVGTSSAGSGYPAFRWSQSQGMVNLGHLPGKQTTHPFDVSACGATIVGGSYSSGMSSAKAFVWDSAHGMRDLQELLQKVYAVDLTGWTLENAFGVSDDGTVIVGSGKNPSGNSEGFQVVLETPATDVGMLDHHEASLTFQLKQNYPNPFNPSTNIQYSLTKPSRVRLSICNLLG
jgi:probable HAF family extracellular repeat protein